MIDFDRVTITYDGADRPVLRDVTLHIPEGELCLVVGATGAGKSTLLGAVNGLVPHFTGGTLAGRVTVAGRDTRRHPPRELADLVGVVGQDPAAGFVTDTVEEELAYGMEQLALPPPVMRKRVEETLDLLGLAELRARSLHTLSGGEQQRVAIGAVLTRPSAGTRARRADLGTRPDGGRGGPGCDHPAGARPRHYGGPGRAPSRTGLPVRRPRGAADRRRHSGRRAAGAACWRSAANVPPIVVELGRLAGWDPIPLSVRDARRLAGPLRDTLAARTLLPARPPRSTAAAPTLTARGLFVRHGDGHRAARSRSGSRRWRGSGADGPQRIGQVVAAMGAAGLRRAAGRPGERRRTRPRHAVGRGRARARRARPADPGDLLYLDTVADELAQADRESGVGAAARPAGRCWTGSRRASTDALHPRDLSEGQRLALVARRPTTRARRACVLLDEPTRGLDYPAKRGSSRSLDELAGRGPRSCVATHDVEFVADVRRPGGGAGRGRGRRRRPGRRGDRRLAGVRAADRQGAGPAAVADGRPQVAALAPPGRGCGDMTVRPDGTAAAGSCAIPVPPRSPRYRSRRPRSGWSRSAGRSLVAPGTVRQPLRRAADLRACCSLLVLAVVFAEIADGGIDAKALAMLGVLSAVNAALRPLGAGTAGIETVFFVLVLAGRVFGPGFGFALGCTSLFASALITGGVGPWLPYQMFGCAWVGLCAGLLPPVRGRAEVRCSPAYGALAGYVFGFLLNLWFWPFSLDPAARSPTCPAHRSPSSGTGTCSSTPPPPWVGTPAGR